MHLDCATIQLDANAAATSGGVVAVTIDPARPVCEIKTAIKRKKPNDLRHVDADALSLFVAADSSSWLPDEHEAAIQLETRGCALHDVIYGMLNRGALHDCDPLTRYISDHTLPPPEPEQIHLLVVVPGIPVKKRKMQAQEPIREIKKPKPVIALSEEQKEFVRLAVEERRNMLLVASAGYGKSAVIETIISLFCRSLPRVLDQMVYGLCAPTGKAASLINGRTIHSFLGIGMGRGAVSEWVNRVRARTYIALRGVQVILVDEISMVSAQFLDCISEYLQKIREDPRPFGGMQMIFVGDLCQLLPVVGAFMFRSHEYARGNFQPYQFTKCFRQNDPEFVALLNEVRFARCSEQTLLTLRKCTSIDPEYANGLKPMHILSTNKKVDMINERELHALTDDGKVEVINYDVRVCRFANLMGRCPRQSPKHGTHACAWRKT